MKFDPQFQPDIALILQMDAGTIRSLDMPEEDVLTDAYALSVIAVDEEYELLIQKGCPVVYLDTFEKRINLFAYLTNYFMLKLDDEKNTKESYLELKPKGYAVRRKIFNGFKVAYRNNPKRLNQLEKIIHGRGDADMILDLLTCWQMGTEYSQELSDINFETDILTRAKGLHYKLNELLAAANMAPDEEKELRELRNRAYTWLYEAMEEIRTFGQWIHEDDEERRQRYVSLYLSERGKAGASARWNNSEEE